MSTQKQHAINGVITPEMKHAAEIDHVSPEWLREQIAEGKCIIPKNKNHNIIPYAIGEGISTKINANIGTSGKHCKIDEEIEKLKIAIQNGAHSIMDLSTGGDIHTILKKVLEHSSVMVGTVPIYSTAIAQNNDIFDPEDLFNEIELQAQMGVDFMTLHCAITRESIRFFNKMQRLTGIVSRGGSLIYKYIKVTGKENPLYEQFDRILDICQKYDVTISLGDGLRPGCITDSNDHSQIEELLVQGELVKRAHKKGVQVMVEGPGHMPLDQIEMNVKLMKKICHGAPLYVLGPLTTDSAAGYDHIAGAIGGAIAATYGANFLCYVTPAEHLCLPNMEDVRLGVIASRIAAHSADVAKKLPAALERDYMISKARFELDWESMFKFMIDPHTAQKRRKDSESYNDDYCTMCGDLCAVKMYKSVN